MKKVIGITAAALALSTGAGAVATAAPAPQATSAAVRHFEGTVASVNRDARTFRLNDAQRGTIRIKVIRSTRFERINGFAGLRRGLSGVEATVRRSKSGWVATLVERSGGGGRHGGGNDD